MTGKVIPCLVVLALMAALLASVTGCSGGCACGVVGSGNLETREMDFGNFTELDVSHAFDVEVTRGDSYQVSITVDDNLWDYVDVHQTGQTVYIGLKGVHAFANVHLEADVTMPELRGLTLSGACDGEVSGFSSAEPLDIDLSGASSLSMDNLVAGDMEFKVSGASKASGSIEIADGDFQVSGAGTIELEGSANNVSIEASGASRAKLADFPVNDATVDLSGASTATVNASGTIDADLSGASHLDYMGDATLGSVETSGASTISKK